MSVVELNRLIVVRVNQIKEIRLIYEAFHYEVERRYRRQVYDYHDHALTFGFMHGKIQQNAQTNNRIALEEMRNQDDIERRQVNFFVTVAVLLTITLWLGLRRNYVSRKEFNMIAGDEVVNPPFGDVVKREVTNVFYAKTWWSGRYTETAWEAEQSEKRKRKDEGRE